MKNSDLGVDLSYRIAKNHIIRADISSLLGVRILNINNKDYKELGFLAEILVEKSPRNVVINGYALTYLPYNWADELYTELTDPGALDTLYCRN